MRVLLEHRAWVNGMVAGVVGFVARTLVPWHADDPILVLIATYRPARYRSLYATYIMLLFTTPYLVTSVIGALASIFVRGPEPHADATTHSREESIEPLRHVRRAPPRPHMASSFLLTAQR